MTAQPLARVHLRVAGTVQGVYFRASTQAQANRLGLVGWVRNRRDGTVEAVVEGPGPQVAQLVEWAHAGPPAARVAAVEATSIAPLGDHSETDFAIRPSV